MSTDRIKVGEAFGVDRAIKSLSGTYSLVLQGDGNFVLYGNGKALWDSKTWGSRKATKGILQANGNLRLFDDDNREQWSSGTSGKGGPDSLLIVQDNGDAVIKSGDNTIWSTDTAPKPPPKFEMPTAPGSLRDRLKANEAVNKSQGLTSPNGNYALIMGDGECILYKRDQGRIWAQGSGAGNSTETLLFRSSGEIEALTWSNYRKWAAGTAGKGNSGSEFVLRDDGNMVIITEGQIVWSSGTGPSIPISDVPIKKKDQIVGGERLGPGEKLTSPNGKFTLVFQSDANLVLYKGGSPRWSSGGDSMATGDSWVQLEKEGNLVQFVTEGAKWSSGSRFRRTPGDAVLVLQDDGSVVLKLDGVVVWSTNGALVQLYAPRDFDAAGGNTIGPGQCLAVGQSITSKNGQFSASLQDDGQFVVRHNDTKTILFRSAKKPGKTPSKVAVSYADNLAVWATDGTKIWESSNNAGRDHYSDMGEDDQEDFFNPPPPGAVVLKDQGNMLMIGSTWPNDPVWTSNSGFPAFGESVSELKPSEALPVGQKLKSSNGDHELSLLPSGHFQLHNTVFNTDKFYAFQPNATIQDASYLSFGRDLVLELYGADGRSIWRAENREPDRDDRRFDREPPPPRFILDNDADIYVRGPFGSLWSADALTKKSSLT